jgi:hypothetical protein
MTCLPSVQAIKRQRMARGAFELNLPEYDFPDDAE